jgi:hypothetical protein
MRNRLRPAIALAVVALFTVPALAACGGGGDSGGVASLGGSNGSNDGGSDGTQTTASQDPEDAALAFVKCMREHGIDMPDPSSGGGIRLTVHPGNETKANAAQKACEPLLQAAKPKLTEEQQTAMQDAALAFAKCMREHGVDMPDPTFGKDGAVMLKRSKGSTGLDPDDPKFKAAEKACQPIVERAARNAGLPPPTGGRLNRSGEADS